ncbi:glycosyltransferase family 4 protein [Motilimonas pumila]|uniref:Glycosyltransferase n=1 Tax=Motilimonas pumila TaxID=2303987 RepID=A0A418YD71_9GAMM|nr:glycosyltransferase family 4 protein [Motilimonas pumila]RJG42470.1 glycosyltransferase [Motilimonas pumila]
MNKQHLVVIDAIPFHGGSKVATATMLKLLGNTQRNITVLTSNPADWPVPNIDIMRLYVLPWFARQEQGLGYLMFQLWLAVYLMALRLIKGKIDIAVGASGPGVDMALYLVKGVMGFNIVQLVHGPVARSGMIKKALLKADKVFYLFSSHHTLCQALSMPVQADGARYLPDNFTPINNGLDVENWPTLSLKNSTDQNCHILWSASLLKWKGLDVFLQALPLVKAHKQAHVCYIKPSNTVLATTKAPLVMADVKWYKQPENLDEIRSKCNVFVSTSQQEPFGLAILEALAAGLCVVIPSDGSYWDKVLVDHINCIKYHPNSPQDLALRLSRLIKNPAQIQYFGEQGTEVAKQYQAHHQYKRVINHCDQLLRPEGCDVGAYIDEGTTSK